MEIPPATESWNSDFIHVYVEKVSLLQTVIQQRNYKIPWDDHNLLS